MLSFKTVWAKTLYIIMIDMINIEWLSQELSQTGRDKGGQEE